MAPRQVDHAPAACAAAWLAGLVLFLLTSSALHTVAEGRELRRHTRAPTPFPTEYEAPIGVNEYEYEYEHAREKIKLAPEIPDDAVELKLNTPVLVQAPKTRNATYWFDTTAGEIVVLVYQRGNLTGGSEDVVYDRVQGGNRFEFFPAESFPINKTGIYVGVVGAGVSKYVTLFTYSSLSSTCASAAHHKVVVSTFAQVSAALAVTPAVKNTQVACNAIIVPGDVADKVLRASVPRINVLVRFPTSEIGVHQIGIENLAIVLITPGGGMHSYMSSTGPWEYSPVAGRAAHDSHKVWGLPGFSPRYTQRRWGGAEWWELRPSAGTALLLVVPIIFHVPLPELVKQGTVTTTVPETMYTHATFGEMASCDVSTPGDRCVFTYSVPAAQAGRLAVLATNQPGGGADAAALNFDYFSANYDYDVGAYTDGFYADLSAFQSSAPVEAAPSLDFGYQDDYLAPYDYAFKRLKVPASHTAMVVELPSTGTLTVSLREVLDASVATIEMLSSTAQARVTPMKALSPNNSTALFMGSGTFPLHSDFAVAEFSFELRAANTTTRATVALDNVVVQPAEFVAQEWPHNSVYVVVKCTGDDTWLAWGLNAHNVANEAALSLQPDGATPCHAVVVQRVFGGHPTSSPVARHVHETSFAFNVTVQW